MVVIIPVIGMGVELLKRLTRKAPNDPIPICNAPINAEALPALRVNGCIQSADVLGKTNPTQVRKRNKNAMMPVSPINP